MADLIVWMYNSNTGAIGPFLPPQAYLEMKAGIGWHGTFKSYQEAVDYYNANKAKNPGWKAPTSDPGKAINNAESSAVNDVTGAITDSFKGLNLPVWFLRIGEIILGIVLVGIGVAKLTGLQSTLGKIPPIIPV